MKIPNTGELQPIASNHSPHIEFKNFIKLYKDYTKESYPFSVNDITLPLNNPLRFFFNWYSLHARLSSHYEAWSYKKRKHKKVKAYRKSI